MPEQRARVIPASLRSLRLALIGGLISALGLLASLSGLGFISWFWIAALLACLAYGLVTLRQVARELADDADTPAPGWAESSPQAPASQDLAVVSEQASAIVPVAEEVRFLSTAGHDMRQPLQAIALFSATLSAHTLPAESAKLVQGIEQAAESLSELFEAVMALARLMAGRVSLQSQDVSLGLVLKRCVAERMDAAQEREIHLRHVPTRLHVRADEAQLARAIDCLLNHALVTSDAGAGVLVGCRREAGSVRIEVWDSGKALPAAALDTVFQPFSAYGQAFKDRGLGLVLAHRLLAAMGGELIVGRTSNADGRGKRFLLRLPA